jgi:hypothetical protein
VAQGDQSERRGKSALSNIPIRVPLHFMGRDDALSAIDMALKRSDGRVAITALHGLRGVGKTTLAAAYAERHRGDYRATWWIRAPATSAMRADLVALGIRLGWVGLDDKEETAVDTVMERLRDDGEGILLIFDNAVDATALRGYLPRGGAAKVRAGWLTSGAILSSSSFQPDTLPAMFVPSKSRPPMSHRKTDLGIPRPPKKVVLALQRLSEQFDGL